MRYFDEKLVANSRQHAVWWDEVCDLREGWYHTEERVLNAAAILPRDAWLEFDDQTRRIMRDDGGEEFMTDIMALARPIDIGKLVSITRISSDMSDKVTRSMSGQVPVDLDKVTYDYMGAPVPMFAKGYGREWRERKTLETEGFDALADDNEAANDKVRRDMVDFALRGDDAISVEGYKAYGLLNTPLAVNLNLGSGAAGLNINLATATSDEWEAFVNGPLGTAMDNNFVSGGVNFYVSPEIARNLDKAYSGSAGTKMGTLRDFLLGNRRINKISSTFMLKDNEFFAFVPSSQYVQPLVGMPVNTVPKVRLNPTDNYQFLLMGAMGIQFKTDWGRRVGIFRSVVVN